MTRQPSTVHTTIRKKKKSERTTRNSVISNSQRYKASKILYTGHSAIALLNPSRFLCFTLSQAETHPSPHFSSKSIVEMAFFNKFGSLVRQSISQNGKVPMASSMLNSIRCMSSSKLFVGGLAWSTDDQSLKDAFSGFGEVTDARVITDRDTGRSRGFGFVSYESTESASEALSAMDGQELGGRNIRVSYATDKRQPQPYNNNYGGNPDY